MKALFKTFGCSFIWNSFLLVSCPHSQMIMIVIPGLCSYMIKLYIDSLTQRGKSHNNESVLLLVGIIVSCLVGVVMRTSLYLRGQITGLLLRKTLTGILY